jgi:class 3 adenylate cyclase
MDGPRGIVGDTPNLAARLQSVAEPNTVVIAESTRKL